MTVRCNVGEPWGVTGGGSHPLLERECVVVLRGRVRLYRSPKAGFLVRHTRLLMTLSALLLAGSGCDGSSSGATSSRTAEGATVAISSRNLPGLGAVLVDGRGQTLYIFEPDHARAVTCTGECASVWPPLATRDGVAVVVHGAVRSALLGSDSNPSGGRVVTYDDWPLYTYIADATPGSFSGTIEARRRQ